MLLKKLAEYSERLEPRPSLYSEGPVRYWINLDREGRYLPPFSDSADPSSREPAGDSAASCHRCRERLAFARFCWLTKPITPWVTPRTRNEPSGQRTATRPTWPWSSAAPPRRWSRTSGPC